jgi:hypothetical protein
VSYLLDNQGRQAGDRFGALAAMFDAWTRAHIEALGIADGWSCWEVGAGGPSVPAWLASRVAPSGRVVATDLDVSWMSADAAFAVRRADVAADPAPEGPFELVHARLVLVHVPQRDEALRRMVGALAAGGRLVLEDFDVAAEPRACPDPTTPDEERGCGRSASGWRSTPTSKRSPPGASTSPPRRSSRRGAASRAEAGTSNAPACRGGACAGERGLEPLITEPESAVLPITPLPTERFGSVAGPA